MDCLHKYIMFFSGYNHIKGRSQVLERELKDIRYSIYISTITSDAMWSLRKPPWRTNVRNYEYLYKLRQFWPNLVQYVTAVSIRFDDNNFQNILNSRKKNLEIESLRSSGISWLGLAGQLIICSVLFEPVSR